MNESTDDYYLALPTKLPLSVSDLKHVAKEILILSHQNAWQWEM